MSFLRQKISLLGKLGFIIKTTETSCKIHVPNLELRGINQWKSEQQNPLFKTHISSGGKSSILRADKMQMFSILQKIWQLELFFNQFAELQKRPFLEKTNLFYEENVQIGASHIVNKLGNSYMIICEYSLLCIYGIFLFFPTDFFYEDCALISVWSYKSAIVILRSSEFKNKEKQKRIRQYESNIKRPPGAY